MSELITRDTETQIRLKVLAEHFDASGRLTSAQWCKDAYDEIERLREQVAELERESDRKRTI